MSTLDVSTPEGFDKFMSLGALPIEDTFVNGNTSLRAIQIGPAVFVLIGPGGNRFIDKQFHGGDYAFPAGPGELFRKGYGLKLTDEVRREVMGLLGITGRPEKKLIQVIRHIRPKNPNGTPMQFFGVTMVFGLDYEAGKIHVQWSVCNGDNFDRRVGVKYATSRPAVVIPMTEDKQVDQNGLVFHALAHFATNSAEWTAHFDIRQLATIISMATHGN